MSPSAHSQAPSLVHLDEAALSDVLLVRAFEEADEECDILPERARREATESARERLPDEDDPDAGQLAAFLTERAGLLRARHLESKVPHLPGSGLSSVPTSLVLSLLFAVGLGTNFFGASKQIPVIANPLMGLILWNLVVFVLLVLWVMRGRKASGGLLERLGAGDWLAARSSGKSVKRKALVRLARARAETSGPLHAVRGRRFLHFCAIALILGALGGLYLRGMVLEFETTWESTFMSQDTAERALRVFFTPASALSGIEVPSLRPEVNQAASWIHLYAVTVLLFVLLPRAVFAWRDGAKARALAKALPLATSDSYFRRLLSVHQGRGLEVSVVPYSHNPSPTDRDKLLTLLHDVFGSRARITLAGGVEYGTEAEEILGAEQATSRLIIVFGLAQTPETEVHGRLIADIRRSRAEEPALVLIDGTGYVRRLGDGAAAESRAEEHRRSWDRVLRDAGTEAVHVELERQKADVLIEAASAALQTSGGSR